MDIFLIVLAAIAILAAITGCFLPIIPGPPLGYIGILLLHATDMIHLPNNVLLWLLLATIIVQISDYFLPIWFTKKFGGSKLGMIGSVIGLIVGLFFPPVGIIIGPIIGAIGGEYIHSRDFNQSIKSGLGSFVGFITTTGAKLILCFVFLYYFIKYVFINL